MRIAIVCNHYPVASGRYMMDAFRRLGHEVKTTGTSTQDGIWGIKVDKKYIWTSDSYDLATWPELVIVMDSDTAVWDIVKRVKPTCPVILYGVDNHVRDYEDDLFVHKFLGHYHGPAYPVDLTRSDMSWLPCAADSKLFTPSPIAWADRQFDVCMVGVFYPKRVEVINALCDAGLSVFAETGLLYEEYRDAYWNARISLCVSAAGDVAQRIFETGRMGCAVMTDPLRDIADPATNAALKLNGRIEYANPKEAVLVARELLGGIDERFVIGGMMEQQPEIVLGQQSAALMAESCKYHTWEERAKVILAWYEREYGEDEDTILNNGDTGKIVHKLIAENIKAAKYEEIEVINHPVVSSVGVSEVESVQFSKEQLQETINALEQGKSEPANLQPAILYTRPKSNSAHKPFLNLGCGRTHFPSERPPGHEMVAADFYNTGEWLNVDKVDSVGADKVFDLFAYPWPLEDNSFDGAILGHIVEHIPHEIKQSLASSLIENGMDSKDSDEFYFSRYRKLSQLQDGFYAFFSELYRVLTPGAIAHIISPYGWSDGGITDPTHTRLLTVNTFHHGLSPEQYNGTFKYDIDCNFMVEGHGLRYTELAKPFMNDPDLLQNAVMTRLNIVYDMYIQLKVVK